MPFHCLYDILLYLHCIFRLQLYEKIRTSYLLTESCRHLGKNFCLAIMLLTYLLVSTDHAVMSSYYNYTHVNPHFCTHFLAYQVCVKCAQTQILCVKNRIFHAKILHIWIFHTIIMLLCFCHMMQYHFIFCTPHLG